MNVLGSIWNLVWYTIVIFAFIAYLVILWQVLTDLFRDHKTSAWVKIIWVVFLVVLPYLTAFVYLLTRGRGMAQRANAAHKQAENAAEQYIRDAAGTSPAAQITEAKALLDAGTISEEEFSVLKHKALH